MSREGVYRTVGGRSPSVQRVALGADASGKLTTIIHQAQLRNSTVGGSADQVVSAAGEVYRADDILLETRMVSMDLVPNTYMRAPGESNGTYALEVAIDAMAEQVGVDPVEFRVQNFATVPPLHEKKQYSRRTLPQLFRDGAAEFGWHDYESAPGSMTDVRWLVGRGCGTAFHPAFEFASNIRIVATDEGCVELHCAFQEMGMGSPTAMAQIVAHVLEVDIANVHVFYGDSKEPNGPIAGGSAQTASVARAVQAAAAKLRKLGDGTPAAFALRLPRAVVVSR